MGEPGHIPFWYFYIFQDFIAKNEKGERGVFTNENEVECERTRDLNVKDRGKKRKLEREGQGGSV